MARKKKIRNEDLQAPADTWVVPVDKVVRVRVEGELTAQQRAQIEANILSEPGYVVVFKTPKAAKKPVPLLFPPGGISYRGEFVRLRGNPRRILQLLVLMGGYANRDTILKWVWDRTTVGEEAVRTTMSRARDAVRKVLRKAGCQDKGDPLPATGRGTGETGWQLLLPPEDDPVRGKKMKQGAKCNGGVTDVC
jgi:hypothetical protein